METWFTTLVNKLEPDWQNLFLLIDPLHLTELEEIKSYLETNQFIIWHFTGSLALRSFLRNPPDGRMLITLDNPEQEKLLPYDLLEKVSKVTWNVKELLPCLDESILYKTPTLWIPDLIMNYKPPLMKTMDRDETASWILSTRYHISNTRIDTLPIQIFLSIRIYEEINVLPDWFRQCVKTKRTDETDFHQMLESKETLYQWLQKQWDAFCEGITQGKPKGIFFQDIHLMQVVSVLFQKGILKKKTLVTEPVQITGYLNQNPLIAQGIEINPVLFQKERAKFWIVKIEELVGNANPDWFEMAKLLGKVRSISDNIDWDDAIEKTLDKKLSNTFLEWITNSYKKAWFQSCKDTPRIIHQILPHIISLKEPFALICFDGMSFQEWEIIKSYLEENYINSFTTNCVYTWIPTLTSYGRKALFSAGDESYMNRSEESSFNEICKKNFDKESDSKLFKHQDLTWTEEYLYYQQLGIIYNIVDELMHSDQYIGKNKKTLQSNLLENLKKSSFCTTIENLLNHHYRIFITTDHGNIPSYGNGIKAEKYLAEERAKRAIVYPDKTLAEEFMRNHQKDPIILFENQWILGTKVAIIPTDKSMFDRKEAFSITHGGMSIEEVIIPFIEVINDRI